MFVFRAPLVGLITISGDSANGGPTNVLNRKCWNNQFDWFIFKTTGNSKIGDLQADKRTNALLFKLLENFTCNDMSKIRTLGWKCFKNLILFEIIVYGTWRDVSLSALCNCSLISPSGQQCCMTVAILTAIAPGGSAVRWRGWRGTTSRPTTSW